MKKKDPGIHFNKYANHAVSLSAYKGDELIRKGSGTALKNDKTPKNMCTLITNFHLLYNNKIRADNFTIQSTCTGADGQKIGYNNVKGFDILKDILIFSFHCKIDCPLLTNRNTKLRKGEKISVPLYKGNNTEIKTVRFKSNKFILDRNVILHEMEGKAIEGMSGSPAIDNKGNFIGIVAGGLAGKNKDRSVFIIPRADSENTYTADYSITGKQNFLLTFMDAYSAFQNREHQRSIEYFDKYLSEHPDDAKAHYHKGNVFHHRALMYADMNGYNSALQCYDRAIELFPDYTQAIFNKGNIYYDLNLHKEAIDCYDRVLKITPYYVKAYINRGNEFVKVNKYKKAIKEYTKAIRYDASYPEAYNNRGNVYMDSKMLRNAYLDYTKALSIDPMDPDTIFNLGTYYYHKKKYKITLDYYNRAIRLKPDFVEYHLGRAELYSDINQDKKAVSDYSKAISLHDKLAIGFYKRGECYYKLKKYEEAITDWERAISLDKKYRKELLGKIEELKNTGYK